MFEFPSLPAWDALHPGISHFPIALLLVVPVLVLAGLLFPKQRYLFAMSLWFLLAGTIFLYLSASTGDGAKDVAPRTPEIRKAIENHENIGSAARTIFTVLTALLAALQYGPVLSKKRLSQQTLSALAVVFLLLYSVAALVLFNVAHSGAVLVHKLGVHARIK